MTAAYSICHSALGLADHFWTVKELLA